MGPEPDGKWGSYSEICIMGVQRNQRVLALIESLAGTLCWAHPPSHFLRELHDWFKWTYVSGLEGHKKS